MMDNEALQALSRKYARGEISRPEYRLHRQTIIDEITGFRQSNSNDDMEARSNSGVNSSSTTTTGQPIVQTTGQASNTLLKAGVISIAVVVVLILMYATL